MRAMIPSATPQAASHARRTAVPLLVFVLVLISIALGASPDAFAQAQPPAQSAVGLDVLYNFDAKCAATAATHCDPAVQDGVGVKVGAMVQGPAGDNAFYGATPGGGTHSWGTIFKVTVTKATSGTTSATATVLYNFGDAGVTDGRNPSGGLTLGGDGNLYGVTYAGGVKNVGTIFRMARSGGTPQILYSFRNGVPDPPAKGQPPPPPLTPQQIDDLSPSYPLWPPILGSDGNLYGVTPSSNPAGGALYQLSAAGVLKCLHRFKGGPEAATYGLYPRTLNQGSSGVFYGTTMQGGLGAGTVFQFSASGAPATIYKFAGNGSDGTIANGVLQGADGNLYGTTYSGGPGVRGVVFRLTLAGQYKILHAFGGNQANPVAGVVEVVQNDPTPSSSSAAPGRHYYLYGTSALSGFTGLLFCLREDADGTDFTVVDNFNGTNGAGPNVTPVLNRADSNLYATAALGGKFNAGVFYELKLAGPQGLNSAASCPAAAPSGSSAAPSTAPGVGTVTQVSGPVKITRAGGGSCAVGAQGAYVSLGDKIETGAQSRVLILFNDGTQMTMSENGRLTIDDFVYDPVHPETDKARYNFLDGAFRYLSGHFGLTLEERQINTAWGCLGIRGTELIGRLTGGGLEVDLISGAVDLPVHDPRKLKTYTAPITILSDGVNVKTSPLTQAQYDAIKAQLFPSLLSGGRVP
jgi:uncharacterized repeat protein (TIGR03803 family)